MLEDSLSTSLRLLVGIARSLQQGRRWQKRRLGMQSAGLRCRPWRSARIASRVPGITRACRDHARMQGLRGTCGGGRSRFGCWRQPLCNGSGSPIELCQPCNCCRRAMIATQTLGKFPPGGTPVRRARIRRRLLGPIPGAQSKTPPRPTGNQDVMSYARSPLCAMSRPVTSVSSSTRMPISAFRTRVMMIVITIA